MYCANCGSYLPDDAGFCPYCGAVQSPQPQTPTSVPSKKKSAGKFIVIAIALVAVIGVVLLVSALFGSNEEAPLKNYCKVYGDGNAKAMMKLYPTEVLKKGYDIRDLEDAEDFLDDLDYSEDDDYELEYTVKQSEKLDARDLEDFADYMETKYRMDADDFSKAYLIQVRLVSVTDGDRNVSKSWVVSYKYDGDWYLDTYARYNCESIQELIDDLS